MDEEEYEEGLGGKILKLFFGKSEKEREEEWAEEEDRAAVNAFILMLADQAGVIATNSSHGGVSVATALMVWEGQGVNRGSWQAF